MKILDAHTPFPEGDHPLDPPCDCPVHVHAEIAYDVFAHPAQQVPFVLLMGDRVPQRGMLAQRRASRGRERLKAAVDARTRWAW